MKASSERAEREVEELKAARGGDDATEELVFNSPNGTYTHVRLDAHSKRLFQQKRSGSLRCSTGHDQYEVFDSQLSVVLIAT